MQPSVTLDDEVQVCLCEIIHGKYDIRLTRNEVRAAQRAQYGQASQHYMRCVSPYEARLKAAPTKGKRKGRQQPERMYFRESSLRWEEGLSGFSPKAIQGGKCHLEPLYERKWLEERKTFVQ
jgi:hypothetical protein